MDREFQDLSPHDFWDELVASRSNFLITTSDFAVLVLEKAGTRPDGAGKLHFALTCAEPRDSCGGDLSWLWGSIDID